MTFYSHVGQFTSPTSTGNQTVTGCGFTPVAVIFFAPWTSGADGWTANSQFCIGVATASTGGYISFAGGDVRNPALEERRWNSSKACGMVSYDASLKTEASLTSFNSDGFVLNWSTVTTSGIAYNYIALGGTDITDASVVSWTGPTSTGNFDVTSVGFQPDFVLHLSTGSGSASPATEAYSVYTMGAMDSAGNQWCEYGEASPGSPTNAVRAQMTNGCLVDTGAGTSVYIKASYVSMLANGFRLNFNPAPTGRKYISLCLKGGKYQVGNWAKTTASDPVSDTITAPMTAKGILFVSDSNTANNSAGDTSGRLMIGASDGITEYVGGMTNKHNVTTSVVKKFEYAGRSIDITNNDSMVNDTLGKVCTLGPTTVTAVSDLHQGIATDGANYYGWNDTVIYKYDTSWNLTTSRNIASDIGVAHLGGGDLYNGVIYIAGYDRTGSTTTNARIGRWNCSDLSFIGNWDISGTVSGAQDASGCAVDTADGWIFVSTYYGSTTALYKFSLSNGAYISTITQNPAVGTAQDIAYYNNALYVVYDPPTGSFCAVVKSDLSGNRLAVPLIIDSDTTPLEYEGMWVDSAGIHILTVLNPATTPAPHVYTFGAGSGFSEWYSTNSSTATQICYILFGYASAEYTEGTPPNVSAATAAITKGIDVTQSTPPNVSATTVAPTIGASSNIIFGTPKNVSAAILTPTISASSNIVFGTPKNVAATIVAPTIGVSTNIVLPTPENVAVAVLLPTVGAAIAPTVPNAAAAVLSPTAALGITLPTPQNVSAAVLAPTVSASSNIVFDTPKNVSASVVAPTLGVGITQGAPPNVAAEIAAITKGIDVTQSTPPNVSAATVAPTLAASSNILLGTPPDVAALIQVLTTGVEVTQPTPPDVAAAIITSTLGLGVSQPTPPNVAAAIVSPTIGASSNIIITTIPDVAAAVIPPVVTTFQIGSSWTQTVPLEVAAAILAPTIDTGVAQTTVPDVAAQTISPLLNIDITQLTSPDVSTAIISPAIATAIAQGTPPDVAATIIAPILATSSNIVLPTPSDVTATTIIPILATAIAQGTPPDVAAAILAPIVTTGKGWVQSVVPDVAASTINPTIAAGIAQPAPPNAEAATSSTSIGLGVTPATLNIAAQTISPSVGMAITQVASFDVAAAVIAPIVSISESAEWVQTVVPNVSAGIIAPTLSTSSNIIQPLKPDVAVATLAPSVGLNITPTTQEATAGVVRPLIDLTVSQPLVPDAAAQIVSPTYGIELTPLTQNVAASVVSPSIGTGVTQQVVPDAAATILMPVITTITGWAKWTQEIVPNALASVLMPTISVILSPIRLSGSSSEIYALGGSTDDSTVIGSTTERVALLGEDGKISLTGSGTDTIDLTGER